MWRPPGQHPPQPLQRPWWQRLHLAATERVNWQQGGDGAGREGLGEGREQSVRDEETSDALGKGAANPTSEGGQGERVAGTGAPGTCCGEHLDYCAGDPGDGQVSAPGTCSDGGFVHARCMWDRAEHLANGHVGLQPCIACRSEWAVRNRPPHPAELAQGLPRCLPGGR